VLKHVAVVFMPHESPHHSNPLNLPIGIDFQPTNESGIIQINPVRCGLAYGRMFFLFAASVLWLSVALFFGYASRSTDRSWEVVIWAILFLFISIIAMASVLFAFGKETILVNKHELIFTRQIGFMRIRRRLKREQIQAVLLGKLSRVSEDDVSIETVSLIYKPTSKGDSKYLHLGYALNAHYRAVLYNLVLYVLEQE
jgi:hypothetical protein